MSHHKLAVVMVILSFTLVFAMLLPVANALTPRDVSFPNDQFTTDLYPGGKKVCGDHVCKPGEWITMKQAIKAHLRNNMSCEELKKWKVCLSMPTKP